MAEPTGTIWDLDPHTAAKHILLRKYLNAWLPKITKYNGRVIFCDGFAGPGVYKGGEDGSPIIALKALLEHFHFPKMTAEVVYLFIEEDANRCQSLADVIAKTFKLPSNVKFSIVNKPYADALSELLDSIDKDKARLAPAFAFIDPFGIKGVPLSIMKRFMEHRGCEVFITIMVGYMNRFISQPEFEPHCDELFGSDEWREGIKLKGQERESFLRNLYHQRLIDPKNGVGAQYARYFTMKNDKNVTIYDLFFATNHWKGIDAMKDAMWNVDQSGDYFFSDATNPDQEMLFTNEPEWGLLFDGLAKQFAGTEQPWETVEETIRRSPFRIMKRELQAESRNAPSRFQIIPPKGARKGTLDAGTMIRFP